MSISQSHPIPTRREVFISTFDKKYSRVALADMLAFRGIDVRKPYHEEDHTFGDTEGTLYVQDIPRPEAA